MLKPSNLFKYGFVIASVVALAVMGFITLSRIAYPFELEWLEGPSLLQVERVLSEQSIYVEPSVAYIPMIYPPLYYYLSAGVAALIGANFLALRLVSLAATIGILFLIYKIIWHKTHQRWASIVGMGLYAMLLPFTGWWIEIARVDTLSTFFLLLMIFLLQKELYLPAGISLALALWTKQTGILLVLPILLYLLLLNWRKLLRFSIMAGLVFGGLNLVLYVQSQGWSFYYLFTLPSRHTSLTRLGELPNFLLSDFALPLFFIVIFMGVALLHSGVRQVVQKNRLFVAVLIGALGLSIAGRLNPGGFPNVLLPAYAICAIFFGIGLEVSSQRLSKKRNLLEATALLLCAVQIVFIMTNTGAIRRLPTDQDKKAWQDLLALVQAEPGAVYIPSHNYLLERVGRTAGFNITAAAEFDTSFGSGDPARWEQLRKQIQNAYNAPGTVILLNGVESKDLSVSGTRTPIVYDSPSVGVPVAGFWTRPETIFRAQAVP